ncbi:uncharacterized protein LOC106441648 [Brassica napus]|uniref:uncharacterized protein LOC106441648 n=1 Tax=Brassica napus TaxID=3708 RepID=UPI0006AAB99E|nr:uncharacterized protein LOC106441648 [Brassica napus]
MGVLRRYMQSPRESHGAAMKQCLRYLQGTTTSYGIMFHCSNSKPMKIIGYSDISHYVDPGDVALSSCEPEFMAGTEAARQAIWIQDLLIEVMGDTSEKVVIGIDNQLKIALTRNPVFYENEKLEVEHVPGHEHKLDILTKALGIIKFKEMRDLIGVQDVLIEDFKLKGENVGLR